MRLKERPSEKEIISSSCSPIVYGTIVPIALDYSTEDAASWNWMDEHKFNAIKEWCKRSLQKSTRLCKRYDSHAFKHWCEDTICNYEEAKLSKHNCRYVSSMQVDEMLEQLGYERVWFRNTDCYGNSFVYREWKVKPTKELRVWLVEHRGIKWR